MRMRYPAAQNVVVDLENERYEMINDEWSKDMTLAGREHAATRNYATRETKALREYLKMYVNSPAGSVP